LVNVIVKVDKILIYNNLQYQKTSLLIPEFNLLVPISVDDLLLIENSSIIGLEMKFEKLP